MILSQRSRSNKLKICVMARNAGSIFILIHRVIFTTLITPSVYMTKNISDHRYDLEVKGKGQIHLKSVLQIETRTSLSPFDRSCSYLAQ